MKNYRGIQIKNSLVRFLILLVFLGIALPKFGILLASENKFLDSPPLYASSLVLNSNEELIDLVTLNNWSGNGTKTNPYLLQNLFLIGEPTSSENSLLFLNNTDLYVKIDNCTFDGQLSIGTGIFLINVSNLIISNNTIFDISYGIILVNSHAITIHNNVIISNNYGLRGNQISNVNLTKNFIMGGNIGLDLFANSVNNTVSRNYFLSHSINALILENSELIDIYYNEISFNNGNGIELTTGSSNNNITNNNITENGGIGVYISNSQNVTNNNLKFNTFFNNGLLSVHSSIIDNGSGSNIEFNYWDEWNTPDINNDSIVDNPYPIPGSAGNQDPYPVAAPYIISNELVDTPVMFSPIISYMKPPDPILISSNYRTGPLENPSSFILPDDLIGILLILMFIFGLIFFLGIVLLFGFRRKQKSKHSGKFSETLNDDSSKYILGSSTMRRSTIICLKCANKVRIGETHCPRCGAKL